MIQGSKSAIAPLYIIVEKRILRASDFFFATYKLPSLGAVGIPLARACPSEGPSLLPVYVSPGTSGQMFGIEIRHLQIKRYGPACKTRSFIFHYFHENVSSVSSAWNRRSLVRERNDGDVRGIIDER